MDEASQFAAASAVIPQLTELSSQLTELGWSMFDSNIKWNSQDIPGMMTIIYARKQCSHLLAVRSLIDAGEFEDARTIARLMPEGMAQLLWAMEVSTVRPKLWLEFGIIEDWRRVLKNEEEGRSIDPEERGRLKQRLMQLETLTSPQKRFKREMKGSQFPPILGGKAGRILMFDRFLRELTKRNYMTLFIEKRQDGSIGTLEAFSWHSTRQILLRISLEPMMFDQVQ